MELELLHLVPWISRSFPLLHSGQLTVYFESIQPPLCTYRMAFKGISFYFNCQAISDSATDVSFHYVSRGHSTTIYFHSVQWEKYTSPLKGCILCYSSIDMQDRCGKKKMESELNRKWLFLKNHVLSLPKKHREEWFPYSTWNLWLSLTDQNIIMKNERGWERERGRESLSILFCLHISWQFCND